MKKTLFGFMTVVTVCSLLFASCGKTDEELIVGSWTSNANSYYLEHIDGSADPDYLEDGEMTFTFEENGTLECVFNNQNNSRFSYNYTVSGDTLTLIHDVNEPDANEYWTIKELTKKQLVIELSIKYSYEINGETHTDGHLVHYEFDRD